MNPNDADAHNSLGYTLANLGRVAEALPHFERAVALNPGNDNAKRNLEQARRALSPR
jgi:Flp pilus assembly protein TadD